MYLKCTRNKAKFGHEQIKVNSPGGNKVKSSGFALQGLLPKPWICKPFKTTKEIKRLKEKFNIVKDF